MVLTLMIECLILHIAPIRFQRVVDKVFALSKFFQNLGVYLDDIVIFSMLISEHFEILQDVFECLRDAGLYVNLKKSSFLNTKVKYLGFVIENGTMSPDAAQVAALRKLHC